MKIRVNKLITNFSKIVGSGFIILMGIKQPPLNIEQAIGYVILGIGICAPFFPIDYALILEKKLTKKLDKDL